MARRRATREYLSPEIVNRGVEDSGPYTGSPSFVVKVKRGLPDFLSSVNLKYVKQGYGYLIHHGIYFVAASVLLGTFGTQIWQLTWQISQLDFTNLLNISALLGFLCLILYIYLDLIPPSTYLLDFACYCPPSELKISKEEYIELAKNSGKFNDAAIKFQQHVLKNSGLGDETYLPRILFQPDRAITLKDGREEAAMLMFGAVDDLFSTTSICPKDIRILVVNCGVLNPTPSLSAMIINHYKLSYKIQSFNLGGMGCAAGITAVDLAKDLLNAYPGSYALVVSLEAMTFTWYAGKELDMLLPNCFFRMGSAAILLSNHRTDRWRAKYELKQLVRTHKGLDNRSFKTIHLREDAEGHKGLSVNKDVIELGGHALKANITTLSPLVLPVSEQIHFFTSLLFGKKSKPYIPDYKRAFEHVCIMATSKKVLDEIEKNLDLTDEYMEASRKTLERFGNTSSSSVWYELAYLEANKKIKRGDRVWQIAFGSGLKCNSAVWKSLRNIKQHPRNPWNSVGN
ncbi:OLC1v1035731C1 [Oldenlandia corymbosa var. corymbosa]|uniref:3-ketoacyl-CoA synthase n=1 Tax=Oldenlandia corymbosa var. corymbosa TaxID=529605 RepID=A0AAV1CV29_OLDCO|nr:OLC1v1035731C1 [Oldenlandia corymbosa var. corymbosa]